MTLPLDNNHHVSVNAHSGKVWISVYSGTGAVVPLSMKQAMQLRRMLFDAVGSVSVSIDSRLRA
jgi:hypothetical protein